jgi:hypothetical protein
MFRSWRIRLGIVAAGMALAALGPGLISAEAHRPPVELPPQAREVQPNVFFLGTATDNGRSVDGYAIVHPRRNAAKPDGNGNGKGNGGGGGTKTSSCFTFMARGAKWKAAEAYVVNGANLRGLDANAVAGLIGTGIGEWEGAASANIFGNGSQTGSLLTADLVAPDGVNEVYFADVDSVGAIAITIVWGRFGGSPRNRELVEWDQVYDDVDYDWSLSGEAGKMDFDNIATHEVGHAAGMSHPEDTCVEETMYRYADYGETQKRDLNAGDIAGIADLY